MLAIYDRERAQVSVGRRHTVSMIDRRPEAESVVVINGIVPAGANHCPGSRAQYWLELHIEIVAIVPIVAVGTGRTVRDRGIRQARPIVAHKDTVLHIGGLIVIEERTRALQNGLTPIIRTMHKGDRSRSGAFCKRRRYLFERHQHGHRQHPT